jgi:hypothetical protein
MKKTESSEVTDRVVPLSFIRQGRNFSFYKVGSFVRVDLIFGEEEGGYKLRVSTGKESLVLAGSKGGEPRTWRSADTALTFIKKHFGVVRNICVLYPMGNEKL